MSNGGDPFERSNKTVLRLNPGGRRPRPPEPAPAPELPASAPYVPRPAPSGPYSGGGQAPPPPPAEDPWFAAQRPAPPPAQNPTYQPPRAEAAPGRSLILSRDVPVAANANLLLEAAGPLLLLLGRLRTSLMSANFANLMDQVADAIEEFGKTMKQESVPPAMVEDALYVVCATCDDIVQNIPTEERAVWARYSMLTRFFSERTGGVRFFEKLDKAKLDPTTNYDLLELMHSCLAMGFQGVHRTAAGGQAQLQQIQRTLYEILRKARPRSREDLSPHWRGQDMPQEGKTFRVPFWALGAVAGAALLGVFVTLRLLLAGNTDAVAAEMSRLFAETQLQIERPQLAVPAQPVPVRASTQLERIRARLQQEIAENKVDPVETGQSITIRVGSFALFDSGQATVKADFAPIAVKIAAALEREPGPIKIVGHTDNTAITTARFPSNYELSVERARAVSNLLRPGLTDASRLTATGRGDAAPIAPNTTAEGRARNRRVEISIPREETLQAAAN